MNTLKKMGFFPEISERDAHLVAPDIYESYRDTEADILHAEYLNELEAQTGERLSANSSEDLGELPFDEEADRTRWEKLEKDFDHLWLIEARLQKSKI